MLTPWRDCEEDAQELYSYAKDPEVGPNAGWKSHESPEESRQIIRELFMKSNTWAIREKESHKIIGSISLENDRRREDVNSREMGYSLSREYWGKGYMTEALNTLRGWAFANKSVTIMLAHPQRDDEAFHGLLRKSGFGHWVEHEHEKSPAVEVWCSEKKTRAMVKVGLLLGLGLGVVAGSAFGISRWISALVGGILGIAVCTVFDVRESRRRYALLKTEQQKQ